MTASSVAARPLDDRDTPAPQTRARAWATTVPYDSLEDAEPRPAVPPRARGPAAPATGRLQSIPGGRSERVSYRPPGTPAAAVPAAAAPRYRPQPAVGVASGSATRMALSAVGAAAAAVLLYLVVSALVGWTQARLDDMSYGTPRTTHLDAVVGNGDSAAQPTHFLALNLNRQVSVLEFPGGDVSKTLVINGPYLFGDGEDLTPVKLRVEDLNGDGKPDLVLTIKSEELVYINDKNTFRPITAAEKATLEAPPPPAAPAPK